MSWRTKEQAQKDFGEDMPEFVDSVRTAWGRYLKDHAEFRHAYEKRTQANIVHDYITTELSARFADHPSWYPRRIRRHRLFLLDFADLYSMKVKKLDGRLTSRNVVTQLVLNFMHQAQAHLPGMDGPTSLLLGYQLNAAETEIDAVWITCPDGSRRHWEWELTRGAQIVDFPSVAPPAEEAPPGKIVRPKRRPKPDEDASNESSNQ